MTSEPLCKRAVIYTVSDNSLQSDHEEVQSEKAPRIFGIYLVFREHSRLWKVANTRPNVALSHPWVSRMREALYPVIFGCLFSSILGEYYPSKGCFSWICHWIHCACVKSAGNVGRYSPRFGSVRGYYCVLGDRIEWDRPGRGSLVSFCLRNTVFYVL